MNKYLLSLILFLVTSSIYCQEKNETIKNQQITISKSYTPELSDVSKIRPVISVNDSIKTKKVSITYSLINIPVFSKFKLSKVSPLKLKKKYSDQTNYNSYFDFGFGSADQLILDLSNHMVIDRFHSFGFDIINTNYGNISSTAISSEESEFILGLDHVFLSQKMEIAHKIFLNQDKINYYGIYSDSKLLTDPLILDKIISNQERNSINFLSNWKFYNSFFKQASLSIKILNDSYGSKEEIVDIKTDISIPIFRMNLLVTPKFSLINSFFKESYYDRSNINSFYSKFEAEFHFSNMNSEFKYKIGGVVNYFQSQSEETTPAFLFSPKILFSFGSDSSRFSSYLTLDGGVDLISYSSISDLNPYVSPTLDLIPTQNLYIGRLGFRSSFDSGIDLNVGSHFNKQLNSFLFKRYAYDPSIINQGFRLANSFGLEYDDISKYGFFGETSFSFGRENLIKASIFQYSYNLDKVSHAWNLPDFEGKLSLNIKISNNLRINMDARYIGKRPTAFKKVFLNQTPADSPTVLKFLTPLSQVKAEINYNLDSKWQPYLRTQFNVGDLSSLWDSYLLNQNLILAGIRYGFNLGF